MKNLSLPLLVIIAITVCSCKQKTSPVNAVQKPDMVMEADTKEAAKFIGTDVIVKKVEVHIAACMQIEKDADAFEVKKYLFLNKTNGFIIDSLKRAAKHLELFLYAPQTYAKIAVTLKNGHSFIIYRPYQPKEPVITPGDSIVLEDTDLPEAPGVTYKTI